MERQTILNNLREKESMFVLMSACTKMPYVLCDEETFDDEVLIYLEEEDIKREGQKLVEKKIPVQIAKVDKEPRLQFFANLYTMGVNCILVNQNMDSEMRIQLKEFVRRPGIENAPDGKLPDGKMWVENPSLHLTSLYFMQEIRRQKLDKLTDELKEQQEEILADFAKGTFLAAIDGEQKGIPLLKQPNGDAYQPLFTDILEFQKFNRNGQFKVAAIEAKKVPEILPAEAKGVVVNPTGVNLQLPINRRQASAAKKGEETKEEAKPQGASEER